MLEATALPTAPQPVPIAESIVLLFKKPFECLEIRCGAVGSAIASSTRGPRFESNQEQLILVMNYLLTE